MTVNGLGGVLILFFILYFIIRLAVKHGIMDAKNEEEKKR